jgi:hypothetical protein
MMPFKSIDGIRIHRITIAVAPSSHARVGLLGWATVHVNGLIVDGVAVRMTREGSLIVTLPARARGELGLRHPIVRIADPDHRRQFDDAVIGAFREEWMRLRNGGDV